MLPTAVIEHLMPGRLRVRVPDRRGDVSYFRSVVEKLSERPEIAGLRANPMTGSILIRHEADPASIRAIATSSEVFDLQEASARRPRRVTDARNRQTADDGATASRASSGPAIGLMSLAFYQALRGNAVGPATENFWNAYGGLRILNSPLIAFVFCGLGFLQLMKGRWVGSASSLIFYAFVVRQLAGSGNSQPASRTDRSPENP
ncbi:hypothetical protein EV132_13831 [Rhizobium sullae]|uniref:HMA domain-containing protein n=1 Tax=Rhizobium sullae TaxID=50338 RepID=A0A4R3PQS8_RHISU|nr:hypothetical protein EV132_13831 [Rhizobium sullae]